MQEQGFIEYIKLMIRRSGMTGKLIAVSVAVSLFFGVLLLIEKLFVIPDLMWIVKSYFAAPGNPAELMYKPWSVITQLFTHGDLMHLLFNMVMLYFTGRIFVQFFGEKRLLSTYLMGGVFAYGFHVLAYYTLPVYQFAVPPPILGASGAIFAIFAALAVYRPNLKVQLFLIPIQIPVILIFILYIVMNLRGVMSDNPFDNTAYFAHLGGALFGALSVLKINSSNNFMNRFERWLSRIKFPKFSFKRKPRMKAYKGKAKYMSDEEYNYSKKQHQERVDAILDKISKKGYEGLTKEEKEILFNESKRK